MTKFAEVRWAELIRAQTVGAGTPSQYRRVVTSERDRFPTLAFWLEGAPEGHPGRRILEDPEMGMFGGPLEEILSALERAQPVRLPSKRKTFREDAAGFLNVRAELNVGYTLARSAVTIALGGPGQPDYQCTLGDGSSGWVEVTTKERDDLRLLHDELKEKLQGRDVTVTIRVPRRVVIPKTNREDACLRVVKAVAAEGNRSVDLPEVGGSASFTTPSLFGGAWVHLEIGSNLAEHGEAVERALLGAIAEKVEQSRRGRWDPDTVLVLDLARLGLSWIRPKEVWAGRLEAMGFNWTQLPFGAIAVVFSDLTHAGFQGASVWREDLPTERARPLEELLAHLGFRHSS
jgi:hypothetical protein